ncbi:hypothetical protein MMJ59_03110 [Enterococcus cecorum]|uniref:Uncharacterized protein n=1 Tax=Enterococcus cecorum TaxID=44008 RepID=A0AAW8TR69_9ENTE|nr:hypothetical protein [Enterococcus cecorum]MCJ0579926.1 hypothetical protein [Enterococcus cecorum]MDT2797294.1 hypothetical protein [Enterococcus cecorum]MDZ5588954.1 hypothetical protein [Enterococcus cecorum]
MEYIGIGIVIAVVIATGIIINTKFNKREAIPSGSWYQCHQQQPVEKMSLLSLIRKLNLLFR